MNSLWSGVDEVLGLSAHDLNAANTMFRAVLVYVCALLMIRLGEKRFLGKNTAFDVIIGVMLGSTVSRAITSASGFWSSLAAGFVLVGLHWLLAVISFRFSRFGDLVKGSARELIRDGRVDWDAMRKSHITQSDLNSALRRNGNVLNPEAVDVAYLERNGNISIIKK
jgi:uncharacterized membrane protein YcaP (DUF421 family)